MSVASALCLEGENTGQALWCAQGHLGMLPPYQGRPGISETQQQAACLFLLLTEC